MFEASRAKSTMAAVPAQSDTETGAQGKGFIHHVRPLALIIISTLCFTSCKRQIPAFKAGQRNTRLS
ncbi:unnamed protein product [Musa hybrid cultivar]